MKINSRDDIAECVLVRNFDWFAVDNRVCAFSSYIGIVIIGLGVRTHHGIHKLEHIRCGDK